MARFASRRPKAPSNSSMPTATSIDLTGKPAFSLCRCGGSVNKPFCDGTHSRIGFQGAELAVKKAEGGRPNRRASNPERLLGRRLRLLSHSSITVVEIRMRRWPLRRSAEEDRARFTGPGTGNASQDHAPRFHQRRGGYGRRGHDAMASFCRRSCSPGEVSQLLSSRPHRNARQPSRIVRRRPQLARRHLLGFRRQARRHRRDLRPDRCRRRHQRPRCRSFLPQGEWAARPASSFSTITTTSADTPSATNSASTTHSAWDSAAPFRSRVPPPTAPWPRA